MVCIRAHKRPRLSGQAPEPGAGRGSFLTLQDLDELPWSKVADTLSVEDFGRLRCTCKALVPPRVEAFAMRSAMRACDSLPPEFVTAAWKDLDWLLHAHMAQYTTACPREAQELQAYLDRWAPSQYKWLRLEHEARSAWRAQGWLVSEELDRLRQNGAQVRSLDLSALYFPPFDGFERCTEGLPVEHLRFSTASDQRFFGELPLAELFRHTRDLRSLEWVPKKHSGTSSSDTEFDWVSLCVELAEALTSKGAPHLTHVRLDFTTLSNKPPQREQSVRRLLELAASTRPNLDMTITWPLSAESP